MGGSRVGRKEEEEESVERSWDEDVTEDEDKEEAEDVEAVGEGGELPRHREGEYGVPIAGHTHSRGSRVGSGGDRRGSSAADVRRASESRKRSEESVYGVEKMDWSRENWSSLKGVDSVKSPADGNSGEWRGQSIATGEINEPCDGSMLAGRAMRHDNRSDESFPTTLNDGVWSRESGLCGG